LQTRRAINTLPTSATQGSAIYRRVKHG